jgi:hypothetical protein
MKSEIWQDQFWGMAVGSRPIFATRASPKRSVGQSQVLNNGELQTSRWRTQPFGQNRPDETKVPMANIQPKAGVGCDEFINRAN